MKYVTSLIKSFDKVPNTKKKIMELNLESISKSLIASKAKQ